MTDSLRRLRMMAMLAARSPEDAEGMAGVPWIADANEEIGDPASGIARAGAARARSPHPARAPRGRGGRCAAAVRARPRGGYPRRAEGPGRGRGRPRVLLAPLQQPRTRG